MTARARLLLFAGVLLVSGVGLFGPVAPAAASSSSPSEYEVKAAFLYNFAKFVEWPAETFVRTGGKVVFGVLGEDPFGAALEQIAREQQVMSRPILIRRANRLSELGDCHIVFVRPPQETNLPDLLRSASRDHRLLIGESIAFAERGGAIGLYIDQRRVRFVVNLAATERARLKVSSKLLQVAKVIRQ